VRACYTICYTSDFQEATNCNLNILFKISTSILLLALFLVGCIDLSWKPPDPGTVMAELSNPGENLSARVIATKVQGTYIFEVRDAKKGNILAQQSISAPVGYHEHSISLTWSHDGRTVSATIDHDFGEDKRVFDLHIVKKGA
jgi:hypothetical protein